MLQPSAALIKLPSPRSYPTAYFSGTFLRSASRFLRIKASIDTSSLPKFSNRRALAFGAFERASTKPTDPLSISTTGKNTNPLEILTDLSAPYPQWLDVRGHRRVPADKAANRTCFPFPVTQPSGAEESTTLAPDLENRAPLYFVEETSPNMLEQKFSRMRGLKQHRSS